MYESPLKVDDLKFEINPLDKAIKDAAASIADQFDNYVIRAIAKTGITVNREELLKALRYDRNQYSKGHKDGMKDGIEIGTPKWIPVTERLPEAHEAVVVFHPKYSNIHIAAYYRELETQPEVHCVNKWYVYGGFGVVLNPEPTHWMPIPEPPKDGET